MQIGIFEHKDFSRKALEILNPIGTLSLYTGQDQSEFLSNKEVLFVRLATRIDDCVLQKATKLKFICSPTTGLNHIDLRACADRGIQIVSLKGESAFLSQIRATPEHTIGLTLSLIRNYKAAFLGQNNHQWDRDRFKGDELYGNSVGIIGFGRVGKILARYLEAFDANVTFYDIDDSINEIYNAKRLSHVAELITTSNIVILTASYSESNSYFIGKTYIDLLKQKYFVNTARGELVDERYLIAKIKEKWFKGVALDVIESEQSVNRLREILEHTTTTNLIVTPHIAGATYSSMYKTEEFIARKLVQLIDGQ